MEVSQVVHRCSTNFRNSKKKEGKRRAKFLIFSRQNVTPRAMQYSSTTNYTRDEDRGGRDLGQGQASGLALVHRLLESVKKRCMQVASIDPATRCFNLRPRYTRPLKTERVASFSTFPSIRFSPRCSSSNILTLDRFHEHECIANRVTCIREERNVNYIGGRGLFYATASVPLLPTLSAPTKLYFQRPPRAYVKSVINEGGALNLTLKFLKSDPLSLRYCTLYVLVFEISRSRHKE